METLAYRFRNSLAGKEVTWTLTDSAIESSGGVHLPFVEIVRIRLFEVPGMRSYGQSVVPAAERCVITPARGRTIVLSTSHFLGIGRFEDRSATFLPFVDALSRRVAAKNPATVLLTGIPPMILWLWGTVLLIGILVGAFGAAMVVVGFSTQGLLSSDALLGLAVFVAMGVMTIGSAKTLRRGRTRRLVLD